MTNALRVLAVKILTLLSFCGGPLILADILTKSMGDPMGFIVAFSPLWPMILGALYLDDPPERWVRIVLRLGLIGALALTAVNVYAAGLFLAGLERADRTLNAIGIAIGLVAAPVYSRMALRRLRNPEPASERP